MHSNLDTHRLSPVSSLAALPARGTSGAMTERLFAALRMTRGGAVCALAVSSRETLDEAGATSARGSDGVDPHITTSQCG
jgi:hypothetical protein